MSQLIDITGQVFGRMTVARRHGAKHFRCGTSSATWSCRCSCGTEKVVLGANLRSGHTISCGCALKEAITKHGRYLTPQYRAWSGMLARCRTPNNGAFKHYGGRGISVCERWTVYENFLADMGERPTPGSSVDRIDNNGNYEPANCRWATRAEQQTNKRTSRNSTSGVTGVLLCAATGKWHAWIKIGGKSLFLGSFETRDEAAIARVAAVRVRTEMLEQARADVRKAA